MLGGIAFLVALVMFGWPQYELHQVFDTMRKRVISAATTRRFLLTKELLERIENLSDCGIEAQSIQLRNLAIEIYNMTLKNLEVAPNWATDFSMLLQLVITLLLPPLTGLLTELLSHYLL